MNLMSLWPWGKKSGSEPIQTRSAASGFTRDYLIDRYAFISGRAGLAEMTAVVQGAIGYWERGFSSADVTGTTLLTREILAMIGRSLALRGESVWWISDLGLIPCSNWALSTQYGQPVAYALVIPEIGGGQAPIYKLAEEVCHFKIGVDQTMPWMGRSPLRQSAITTQIIESLETALGEVFRDVPLGSSIVPFPESKEVDLQKIGEQFRSRRGNLFLRESVQVAAGGGVAPQSDWSPNSLSPDLSKSVTTDTLENAQHAILQAYGVVPALYERRTTGPLLREASRFLFQYTLQPICLLIAEECSAKLASEVAIDCVTPAKAYDESGRARSLATTLTALADAKTAGLSPGDLKTALDLVHFEEQG
jgi:hypothetical protein